MKKKIRFLATSDLHSDINLLNAIDMYTNWDDIDFVILTGDVSEKKNDFERIFKTFKDKQIFFVPGNHETRRAVENMKQHYNVHLVGNNPVIINDDLALFGSNYMSIGPFGVSEQEVFENMVENFEAVKNIRFKIHLSHIPPHNTKLGNASPFFPFIGGSQAVRNFLYNFSPDVTFVGHIHESSGLEEIVNNTKVINLAQTFKIFEFDDKEGLKEVKQDKKN